MAFTYLANTLCLLQSNDVNLDPSVQHFLTSQGGVLAEVGASLNNIAVEWLFIWDTGTCKVSFSSRNGRILFRINYNSASFISKNIAIQWDF